MATTTNYGWTTPDDTALVKDGASAIRSLGTSIDTTTKNLNPSTTLGDIEYRSSTANTNTRLGIGSTGDVLTVSGGVPVWAAPSSGGMTLISTTTLTGASVTLSSIPSTYKNLQLIVRNFKPATDAARLLMRFNSDSTANRHRNVQWSVNTSPQTFSETSITISTDTDNTATTTGLAVIDIPDYANAVTWKTCNVYSLTTDSTQTTLVGIYKNIGYYNQTTAISSLDFLCDSGNFTSGSVLLYGVK